VTDYDVFVQGQDFELSDLKLEPISESADNASVKATFNNFGEAKRVDFDHDVKGWMIDEIKSGCQSLSDLYRPKYCE
jgi:hypothetical protein